MRRGLELLKRPPLSLVFSIAVLCGIIHGVVRFRNEPTDVRTAGSSRPNERSSGSSTHRKGSNRRVAPTPPAPVHEPLMVAAGEELTAHLDAANAAIAQGSYLKAIASIRQVEAALEGRSGTVATKLLQQATVTAARARLYRAFTRSIQAHEFLADGTGRLREVRLAGVPEPITALLIESQEDQVVLELDDGSRRSYAASRVSSMDFMTAEHYRSRVTTFIDKRLRAQPPSRPLELYRLAYTCFQHELVRRGTDLLDLAMATPNADVLLVFAEGNPGDNLKALQLLSPPASADATTTDPTLAARRDQGSSRSVTSRQAAAPTGRAPRSPRRERPGSRPPAQASPDAAVPDPTPTANSRSTTAKAGGVSRDPRFLEAHRLFDRATDHYRQSLRSLNSASGQAELRSASELLEQVMEIYSKLAEKYPADSVLEQDAQHAQQMLYDCNKSLKVD